MKECAYVFSGKQIYYCDNCKQHLVEIKESEGLVFLQCNNCEKKFFKIKGSQNIYPYVKILCKRNS